MTKYSFITGFFLFICFTLAAGAQNKEEWQTYFEKSNYSGTPGYNETIEYFNRFEKNSPYAKMARFGVSPQGRPLYCLIVSKDKCFTPEAAKKSGLPIILINNGIHSGEIEGKDASMLLLRDILITKEKASLLDKAILLIIPVLNVDGHERISKYNRINQNGPEEMGWRTTAQNLNLNRDFLKADAPEMQALLKLFAEWLPDFFVDTHTTDGADYQYTLTYGVENSLNLYRETADFVSGKFIPFMKSGVERAGYLIAPYINFWDEDIKKGIIIRPCPPRFSHGYAAAQNRPGLLIETHMLKPYKERVFATKTMLDMVIEFANINAGELVRLNKKADTEVPRLYSKMKSPFPILLDMKDEFYTITFKGNKWIEDQSPISGGKRITYTPEKYDFEMKVYDKSKMSDSIIAPYAYIIPREWREIAERLRLHGVVVEETGKDTVLETERYKFTDVKFQQKPFEGRQGIIDAPYNVFTEKTFIPAGAYVIKTGQRSLRIILQALEPKGYDSFLKWGFFNSIFEVKEYFEDYVMEKEALKMIAEKPALKAEFEKELAQNRELSENPHKRLAWFYERSPYFDKNLNLYPIMRLIK